MTETKSNTKSVTSALHARENHDGISNVVNDTEINPMTDMLAQDESPYNDIPEPESVERGITMSQRRTEAAQLLNESELNSNSVKNALYVCKNPDHTINVVDYIEMSPTTDILAQDESNNHDDLWSANETLSGGSNRIGIFYSTQYNFKLSVC